MPTLSKQQFGARLQELRLSRGLSQADLAQKAGVALWSVRSWEAGKNEPGWGGVVALADALGVSTEGFREPKKQAPRRRPPEGAAEGRAPCDA